MSTNVVNLDALIPREDFAVTDARPLTKTLDQLTVIHLEGPFFGPDLRKPDFQRATQHWTPTKVVELIRAFVDKDLIPAVILWRSGSFIFVVDGAHRLSALLAWIFDDYGDRQKSMAYFGGHISDDQRKIAQKTRELVNKTVGSYAEYRAARGAPGGVPEAMKSRLSNLADANLIAQWVPTNDATAAEDSFFKINQAATALDATETRILKARRSASAIASRAVMNAGTGHKYWSAFPSAAIKEQIEALGDKIYRAIYEPPITSTPLNTLDVPLAGKGYNSLPFIFELVNQTNRVEVPDATAKRKKAPVPPIDETGETTLSYLKTVFAAVEGITTDHSGSLGLHPVVYCYSRTGTFQPVAFFGALLFVNWLKSMNALAAFIKVRSSFEEYLLAHREVAALMAHTFGAGARSYPWMGDYYKKVFQALGDGLDMQSVEQRIAADKDFGFTTAPRPSARRRLATSTAEFGTGTKTMAYFDQALPGSIRCAICGARVHKNSMHIDHKTRLRDGGHSGPSNAQVAHPYCDSTIKG